ncbi:MAG: lactonase family protein [Neisseriaceae bacterium]
MMNRYSLALLGLISGFAFIFSNNAYSIPTTLPKSNSALQISKEQCEEKHYLYATHPKSTFISVMKIDPKTGNLIKQADVYTVVSPGDLHILTLNNNKKYVYTFGNFDETLMVYSIESDGNLKNVQTEKIVGDLPFNISFDHDGNHMYLSNTLNDNISMFKVNRDNGKLIPMSPPTIPSYMPYPAGLNMNPNSPNFVYITDYQSNSVSLYRIDQLTHILIPLYKYYPTGFLPRLAWFDKKNHAYILNLSSNDISMFYANPQTGDLTPLSTPTVATGVEPLTFVLSPSDKYAYVGTREDNSVHIYNKNERDGVLTPVENLPIVNTGGTGARNIVIDTYNNTSYLYVSNSYDSTITKFKLDSNGLIEPSTRTINDTEMFNPEVIGVAALNNCN